MNALETTKSDYWISRHRLNMQQAKLFAVSHPGTFRLGSRCLLHSLASHFPGKRKSGQSLNFPTRFAKRHSFTVPLLRFAGK